MSDLNPRTRMTYASAEEAAEAARASKREWAARKKAELASLSRMELLAYRLRASLGENYDPYTQSERKAAEEIRQRMFALQSDTDHLNAQITRRLTQQSADNPALAKLATALEMEGAVRFDLKPF